MAQGFVLLRVGVETINTWAGGQTVRHPGVEAWRRGVEGVCVGVSVCVFVFFVVHISVPL